MKGAWEDRRFRRGQLPLDLCTDQPRHATGATWKVKVVHFLTFIVYMKDTHPLLNAYARCVLHSVAELSTTAVHHEPAVPALTGLLAMLVEWPTARFNRPCDNPVVHFLARKGRGLPTEEVTTGPALGVCPVSVVRWTIRIAAEELRAFEVVETRM